MLAATSIPCKPCEKIQSKAINASLSKCGFSRKTSQAVVFGAFWFGGLGWRHINFEEDIQHILTIIKHLRTPGPFQSLLQICLDWSKSLLASRSHPYTCRAWGIRFSRAASSGFSCWHASVDAATRRQPNPLHDFCPGPVHHSTNISRVPVN